MSQLKLTVESQQSFNKGTIVTKADGTQEPLKEKLTRLILREGDNTANILLPYEDGKQYTIGQEVNVSLSLRNADE